ncbi:DUF551 domain-containing protein [Morganella morganii]|uniref:DUF551 domain-containing protein n=1 Tax=Morganella morganii TaxID=582 RepID=UPI00331CD6CF
MKMEWIKCSERMPGRYTNVMVRDKDGWVIDCFFTESEFIHRSGFFNHIIGNVTHWMPQPPEE